MINYEKLPSDKLFAMHSNMNETLLYYMYQARGTWKPKMWERRISLLMKKRKRYAHKPVA